MSLIKQEKIRGAAESVSTRTFSRSAIIKKGYVSEPPAVEEKEKAPQASGEVVMIPMGEEPPKQKAVPQAQTVQAARAPEPPPSPLPPPVDKVIIEEAERKAAEIVKKGQQEAKKLIEESKLYCQTAFSQAEREGFIKGKEEGFEAGREEMATLIQEARKVLEQTIKQRQMILKSIEPEVAKLSISIAERIIQSQVSINQDIVLNLVRSALEKLKDREDVVIKVSPDDLEHVRSKKATFGRLVQGVKTFDIVGDAGVERGGCIIETNLGNVDAMISTQLAAVQVAFEEVAGGDEGTG